MKRLICWAARAAAIGALALLVSPTIVSAQEPPAAAPPPPAEDSTAPAAPSTTEPPQANPAPTSTDPSGCKGLAEKPCRKNKACVWIIPKEVDKSGKVKSPYCHKLGHTKKKAKKTGAAMPQGAAQPAAPPPEQSPAEQAAPAAPDDMPNP